jgi:hypothetical protein
MYYAGVDIGISGALCLLSPTGEILDVRPMPVQKTRKGQEVNAEFAHSLLSEWRERVHLLTLVIEEPGGSKSAKAGASMAGSFHAVRAVGECLGLKIVRITPQSWQKKMLHCKAGDTKVVALQLARSLWPQQDWRRTPACRTPDSGIVDASLIAEHCRRERL